MNPTQNKTLHMLLSSTGLTSQKKELVLSFSHGRCESSRDLTDHEARELVNWLRTKKMIQGDPVDKMRKKIISMAHEMGWHTMTRNGHHIADMERINAWMQKSSYLHKSLNEYEDVELPKLVTQFESVYKSFLNKI